MFQIESFKITTENGIQTGIVVEFTNGQTLSVPFSDIPANITSGEAKAAWLKDRLNELLTVGTYPANHPLAGQPIRHYTANVVALSDIPFAVGVSLEAH